MPETPPPGATPTGFQRNPSGGIRWQPPTPEELALLLPGYEIECLLGRGGMGAVYKGLQKALDRPVAIKILPPDLDDADGSFAERFKNEARLMAKMDHPAIVAVFDFGVMSAGQLYFVMAFIDGTDVARMISEQGCLPAEHALAVTAHVCDALAYAHARGVVHRDIKPANVLINMEGQVKVADFGLAKAADAEGAGLTKTGLAMGTPDYVAPEALILGADVDGRADLYAVGVMLYQMLTGVVPRGAWKDACVVVPGLDRRFDDIIDRAMQTDPSDRYQSAEELRRDLDVILTTPMVQERGESSVAIPKQVLLASQTRRAPAKKAATAVAVKAVSSEPASKLPWIIGIAAAVVIGLGGLVMMGKRGGEERAVTTAPKTAPVTTSPAPPLSVSPVDSGSLPPSPASPPILSVSSAPTPQVAASSETFPPGRWVKVYTKFEDLPEELRKADSGVKFEDGWIRGMMANQVLGIPRSLSSNYAIRLRSTALSGEGINGEGIAVRKQESEDSAKRGHYFSKLAGGKFMIQQMTGGSYRTPFSSIPPDRPAKGQDYTLEVGVVGRRLVSRLNSSIATVLMDDEFNQGTAFLSFPDPIRDIEVINLDGLPEAEALKLLGVDETGKDLRQPTALTSSSPAPPVSTSSSPTASAQFPPGQWVKVFSKFEDLPEKVRKIDTKIKVIDGKVVPTKNMDIRVDSLKTGSLGIRAVIDNTVTRLNLGQSGIGNVQPRINQAKSEVEIVTIPINESTKVISTLSLPSFNSSVPHSIEFTKVDDLYFLRVNDQLVGSCSYDEHSLSFPSITGMAPISDIEVINLDGIPEAEALRLVGVDEQGNDLRAPAAKEAEAKTAAEQEASAIAAIPELKELHAQFEKLRAERVEAVFTADLATLNTGYLGGLDRTIAEEKRDGHLDGVLALEAEKKLVQGAGLAKSRPDAGGLASPPPCPIPADEESTPEALKKLRQIYRDSFAKLETQRTANLKTLTDPLGVRLKQLESSLTQKNRIDDAKFVRGYRERLEQGSAGTPAGSEATPKEAGKSADSPATKFPSGDDRKAAEYALDLGGKIEIRTNRGLLPIARKEDLPTAQFEITRITIGRNGGGKPSIPFAGLAPFSGLGSLEFFEANAINVTDADAEVFATTPSLNQLHLMTSDSLKGESFDSLTEIKNLRILNVSYSVISPEGFAKIARLPLLKELSATQCGLIDDDLLLLKDAGSLETLGLARNPVTLSGWTQLAGLKLKEIQYNPETGKSDQWAIDLAKAFPDLTHIQLVIDTEPVPQDFAALSVYDRMVELSLSCRLGGVALTEAIARHEDLQILHIQPPNPIEMDEGSFEPLLSLKKLHTLTVQNVVNFSSADLMTLSGHKNLRRLNLKGCPKITEADLAGFTAERPDVTVTR